MRVLSLFSGGGFHDLGLQWAGMEIVGQIEIKEECQPFLKGNFPKAKRWRDIQTVSVADIRRQCGRIDLITGGFPCQDISTAGKGKGITGEASGLWREMWRIIRGIRPDWLLVENSPALRVRGADGIFSALEAIEYTTVPLVVGAIHAGASHERRRVFVVAYHNRLARRASEDEAGRRLVEAVQELTQPESASISLEHINGPRLAQGGVSSRYAKKITESKHANKDVADIDGADLWQQLRRRCRTCGQDSPFAFVAGQGIHQHDWEELRTFEPVMGSPIDGRTARILTEMLGEANPPPLLMMIGRAIMTANNVLGKEASNQ